MIISSKYETIRGLHFKVVRKVASNFFIFQCNKFLRWCPAPECKNAVLTEGAKLDYVSCTCGFRFCFGCGLDEHQPLECELLQKWLKKCSDDSETTHYLQVNTKVNPMSFLRNSIIESVPKLSLNSFQNCPKCHVAVKKAEGCN